MLPSSTTPRSLAWRSIFWKKPIDRCTSVTKSLNTGRIAWNTRRGSSAFRALRFRCSALAKVSFNSFVSCLVKWLPPIGILRCQTRNPLVTTKSLDSVPIERITSDSGGLSESYSSSSGPSRSKSCAAKL